MAYQLPVVPNTVTIAGHVVPLGGSQALAASDLTNGTTGAGDIVLETSPTIASPTFTGTVSGLTANEVAGLAPVATSGSASDLTTGTLPNARLSAVPNSALANSAITIAGHTVALGGSQNLAAADLTNGTTGSGGEIVLQTSPTINSPVFAGTVAGAGTIPNSVLADSAITIAGHTVNLGGSQNLAAADLTNGTTGSGGVVLATSPILSNVDISGGAITGMPIPVNPGDVANKSYVDSVASGLTVHTAVAAATTVALPNSPTYSNGASGVGATLAAGSNGALTVDGYAAQTNDRLLVKNEATGADNGVYVATNPGSGGAPYVLTRATDFDDSSNITPDSYFFVENGATNAASGWLMTTSEPITIGTTVLTFTQFSASTQYLPGSGLTLTGNTFALTHSSITIAGHSVSLGGSQSLAASDLANGLTGSGDIVLAASPTIASPTFTGTVSGLSAGQIAGLAAVATSGSAADLTSGTLPNGRLSAVPNSALANSSITLAGHTVSLGGSQPLAASDLTNGTTGSGNAVLANSPTLGGNVGIGRTSPGYLLNIDSGSHSIPVTLRFSYAGNPLFDFTALADSGIMTLQAGSNNIMNWDGVNGNVGIGTIASYPLDVAGANTGNGQSNGGGVFAEFIDGLGRPVVQIRGGVDGSTLPTDAVLNIGGNGDLLYAIDTVGSVRFGETIAIQGSSSGSVVLTAEATASGTLTVPSITGTLITSADTATVTHAMLVGSIPNSKLANSSITIAGYAVALGGSQSLAASDLTNGTTGSGNVVLATSPTIASPTFTGTVSGLGGINIVATGGSSSTSLANRFGYMLNAVTDFGADPTGGSDSTTAIQNGLTAATPTGSSGAGILYLPPGNYKVTSTLTIPSGVNLIGVGQNVSIIQAPNYNGVIMQTTSGASYSYLQDFFIAGGQTGTKTSQVLLYLPYGTNPRSTSVGHMLRNLQLIGGYTGLSIAATDCVVENVYPGYQFGYNILSNGANWYIRCKIDQTGGYGGGIAAFLQGTYPKAGICENHFVQCDFSVSSGLSFAMNSGGQGCMISEGCVVGEIDLENTWIWVCFNACEIAGPFTNNPSTSTSYVTVSNCWSQGSGFRISNTAGNVIGNSNWNITI